MGKIGYKDSIEIVTHEVLIFGAGIAGLRAAIEISQQFKESVSIGIVSNVQILALFHTG